MKVLYYCGIKGCEKSGTLQVDEADWKSALVRTRCPECGEELRQSELHFEDFNTALQRERVAICLRPGQLTRAERKRLREIHDQLGHRKPSEFDDEQASLVMRIASNVMARVRNEEKN